MRALRRPLLWIALAMAAIGALIVAWITLQSGGSATAARPRFIPGPPPRRAAPPASANGVPPPADLTRLLPRLREQLPASGYWRDDAPTTDPAEAARRVEDERRWNALYGKVLSGTGSSEEIDRYYDHLRRRSEDYLRLADAALAQPLPERERALLVLAARMNRERLAALPREREQAMARKRLQDQRRAEWHARQPPRTP
jgi:hypothetical protein